MIDSKIIEVRAHTQILESRERNHLKREMLMPEKWPERTLILDCETTTDQRQTLLFGTFMYCRAMRRDYSTLEGIFYADDLDDQSIYVLESYCRHNNLRPPLSRKEFIKRIFLRAIRAEALIVGFNLFFDLSHIATDASWTPRQGGGWSFTMNDFTDKKTGKRREDQYAPRLVIKPKDGKGSFFKLTRVAPVSSKRPRASRQYPPIRCVDLKTLAWALENQSHSLDSACKARGIQGKLAGHTPSGRVSHEEIAYNRQDVRATLELLNALRAEFDRHPVNLNPDRAYSPASIAKAYLQEMGVIPPGQKFNIPPDILGIAMQAYYGGRAECRIRRTPAPIVHTDVRSEYPTVNTLMGLWWLLTAENLQFEDATEDIRNLLAELKPDHTFNPALWSQLTFFALIQPSEDILPVRTKYAGNNSNIGVNHLTSDTSIWYAGPDVVAAKLLSGRSPKIIRAFRVVPHGQQSGLKKVALRNMVEIDPAADDFFKVVIEARERVKADKNLAESERHSLQYFLKILANSGSYGLFVEMNPERVGRDRKTGEPARAKVRVFSGDRQFETTSTVIEKPGEWYCPLFASLITAGGRLILAMLENTVAHAGGTYLMCDTDSMAIVASPMDGLVACPGGQLRLSDNREAVRALSHKQVREIVAKFEQLNPYERRFGPASIIKIEDVNFSSGEQIELFGYAIAAKRYAFFSRTLDGIHIEKASAHGLGFLFPPKRGKMDHNADAPLWVVQAWEWILRHELGLLNSEPSWFSLPAMMRFTITTPEVLRILQARQKRLPYRDRAKPSNFVLSPVIDPFGGHPVGVDPQAFTLIAPFASDPAKWQEMKWMNLYDGKTYQLAKPGSRLPFQVEAQTYGDIVMEYRRHPEAKSLASDDSKCTKETSGLLRRTLVIATSNFATIGKETNRKWEREDDISLLESDVIEYRPNETNKLVMDADLQRKLQKLPTRPLAKVAHVSRERIRAAKRGRRIRKSTADKIRTAVDILKFRG
jgi:hypothetical protein